MVNFGMAVWACVFLLSSINPTPGKSSNHTAQQEQLPLHDLSKKCKGIT